MTLRQIPAKFRPGTGSALAQAGMWLLVDKPLGDDFVQRLWTELASNPSADDLLDLLLSPGVRQAPAFVMVAGSASEVRILARGIGRATVSTAHGDHDVAGQALCADETAADALRIVMSLGESVGETVAPLIAGMAPADSLCVTFVEADPGIAPAISDDSADSDDRSDSDPLELGGSEASAELLADGMPSTELSSASEDDEARHDEEPGDPESLAALREYESLLGNATHDAPAPSETQRHEGAAVGELSPHPAPETAPANPPVPHAQQEAPILESFSTDSNAHQSPVVHTYAAEEAPPTSGVIIESVPDFFGVMADTEPSPSQSHVDPPARPTAYAQRSPLVERMPGHPSDQFSPVVTQAHQTSPVQAVEHQVTARTVNRAHLTTGSHTGPTVWAARCPLGHHSQAFASTCRVCGQPIPPQEPQEIARPILGRLAVAGGPQIPLDGDLILGRDPHIPPGAGVPQPRLIILKDPRMEVSSQHASVTLNFWDVCLTDLGSTNGTEIVTPDGRRQRLAQHVPITIQPGTRVVLAEVLELVFEVTS